MISELARIHGLENLRVTLPCRPLRTVFGLMFYTSSKDDYIPVGLRLKEEQYKIADRYKVEFEPTEENGRLYAPSPMYQSDLDQMLRNRHASIRVLNMEQLEGRGQ